MNPVEVIRTKRDGGTLPREAIAEFVHGHCVGTVSDPQMAAFLMAVCVRGMTYRETVDLTDVMTRSGEVLRFTDLPGPAVDKHSTGGVGDKVSLILAPMVASCGAFVPMLSGRGLGHTGGTLDKLEAIPGFRTGLTVEEFRRIVRDVGFAMASQSDTLVPADRSMYTLRDATGTIESPPLIAGSILSKKLAEGIGSLVLDVTTGEGAFMRTEREAEELAELLCRVGTGLGLSVRALLTMMDQPRGCAVGTWLEVCEAVDCLRGAWVQDLMEVTLSLGASLLHLSGLAPSFGEGWERCRNAVTSGRAYETFLRGVRRQGGDTDILEHPDRFGGPPHMADVCAERDGWVTGVAARAIGDLAASLGAGRRRREDVIDPRAGILVHAKLGDRVVRGERMATIHAAQAGAAGAAARLMYSHISIGEEPVTPPPRVVALVDAQGRSAPPAQH
jgi:pyrimidine-nucleoside phosphorylase